MKSKQWYESKAILSGLALVAVGIFTYATGYPIQESIITVLEGLGVVGVRQAVN